jgi:hypothetical protein
VLYIFCIACPQHKRTYYPINRAVITS